MQMIWFWNFQPWHLVHQFFCPAFSVAPVSFARHLVNEINDEMRIPEWTTSTQEFVRFGWVPTTVSPPLCVIWAEVYWPRPICSVVHLFEDHETPSSNWRSDAINRCRVFIPYVPGKKISGTEDKHTNMTDNNADVTHVAVVLTIIALLTH